MKRSPLVVIFTTIFIDLLGFGIVIPVLPFYAEGTRFNATPRTVGLLFASYSIMQLIFSPVLGRLSDKYGRRPALLVSTIGTGIGLLILGFATTLWMLFLGRILDGISGGNSRRHRPTLLISLRKKIAPGHGPHRCCLWIGVYFRTRYWRHLESVGYPCAFSFRCWSLLRQRFIALLHLARDSDARHPARTSAAAARGFTQLINSLRQPRLGFILTIYFLFIVAFSIMTTSFSLYTMFRFGYDAQHNGYLFAYVGLIAVVIQGGLIGRLVKRFGELPLVIVGALFFAGSLFAVPFVGPGSGGLLALLIGGGIFSLGNSLSTPALNSLASKSVGAADQGGVMGVMQSVGSLARAVGPSIAALLIHSTTAYKGLDGQPHYMSDHSLFVTFWTGSAIMFLGFLLAQRTSRVCMRRSIQTPRKVSLQRKWLVNRLRITSRSGRGP